MMIRCVYVFVRKDDSDSGAVGDAGHSFLCAVVLRVFADKSALLEVEGDVRHPARISLFFVSCLLDVPIWNGGSAEKTHGSAGNHGKCRHRQGAFWID